MSSDYDKRVAMQHFALAYDAWRDHGVASVRCDACDGVISFEKQTLVTRHDCPCGKYRGAMQSHLHF